MFEVLKTAGVSVTDFAKIAGVSRVSVSHWVNGKMNPHKLHASKIQLLLDAMQKAVDTEELPIPVGMDRVAALKRTRAAILKHVVELRKGRADA